MKKYTQVILIIVVALLICMGCTDELLPSELWHCSYAWAALMNFFPVSCIVFPFSYVT
jgi:hypothetical protein